MDRAAVLPGPEPRPHPAAFIEFQLRLAPACYEETQAGAGG